MVVTNNSNKFLLVIAAQAVHQDKEIDFTGWLGCVVAIGCTMLYTYATNACIPAFGAPSLRAHVGFLPAGRRVRGSAHG